MTTLSRCCWTDKARNEILHISSTSPREIGLKFSTWSLRSIAGSPAGGTNVNATHQACQISSSQQQLDDGFQERRM